MLEDELAQDAEALDDSQTQYALSTDILNLIQTNITKLIEEYPNESIAEIIYTLVLTIIRSPQIRRTNGTMVPDILVYYLESYKKYKLNSEIDKQDDSVYLNEAGLALFDIYVNNPHNQTKRKLMEMIAVSMRDHWVDRVVKDDSIEGMDEFNIINNLTLLTNTLPFYTARPRRDKNLSYVLWMKDILTKLFTQGDSRFLLSDHEVTHVLGQVTKRQKIILITKH